MEKKQVRSIQVKKNESCREQEDYNVTFLPVTINGKNFSSVTDLLKSEDKMNSFLQYSLPKGKYDINYVINLLRIILDQCHKMKGSPRDLQFTLWISVQKLLSMLEVERDQNIYENR